MKASQSARCRSYLPIIPEDNIFTHEEAVQEVLIQPIPPVKNNPSHRQPDECTYSNSFIQETTESFAEIYSILKQEMKEYHCLPRALVLYLISIQLNLIISSTRSQLFFNFIRYYPIIVGWIYLASKCNRFINQNTEYSKLELSRDHPSTDTCDTVSSGISQDSSELHLEQTSHSWGHFANLSISSSGSHSLPNMSANDVHLELPLKSESCSWGYFADLDESASQDSDSLSPVEPSSIGEEIEITCSLDLNDPNQTCTPKEMDSEWGFFADFPDEGPRTNPPLKIVEKERPTYLQRSTCRDYYDICVRFVRMHTS